MNYIEWILARGKELLREREETLKKRLSLVPGTAAQGETARAGTAEEEAARETETDGSTENTAAATDLTGSGIDPARGGAGSTEIGPDLTGSGADLTETAVRRLGRKLGLGAKQESGETGEEASFPAAQAGAGTPRAASLRAGEAESAGGTLAWLQEFLSGDGRDGAAAAAATARASDVFTLSQERGTRETEAFSLSLERDARRYDGGFLYY